MQHLLEMGKVEVSDDNSFDGLQVSDGPCASEDYSRVEAEAVEGRMYRHNVTNAWVDRS
jgi:hypothetical protein